MASQFDDLLNGVVNRLKSFGIGTKSPEQQAREADPVLRAQFERRMPTYAEIMESRRLRGQSQQQTQAPNPYADRTPSNIQAQAGQRPLSEYPVYYGSGADAATSYSADMPSRPYYDSMGQGGYSRGGLFQPDAEQPVYDVVRTKDTPPPNRNIFSYKGRDAFDPDFVDQMFPNMTEQGRDLIKSGIVPVLQSDKEQLTDAEKKELAPNMDTLTGDPAEARSGTRKFKKQPYLGGEAKYTLPGMFNRMVDFYSQETDLPTEVTSNPLYSEGYFTSTPEAVDAYRRRQAERLAQREAALANNIPQEQQDMEMRRMLSQAETAQRRQANLDAAGMDMPYKGQQVNYDAFGNVIDSPEYEVNMDTTPEPKGEEEQGMFDTMMQLLVSPVYGAETVQTAPTEYGDFGEVVNASTARFISPAAAQSDQLLSRHLGRLGADSPEARSRLAELASKVAMIESDGNMRAKNKDSSATGLYQFLVDDSKGQSALQTAVKRTKKYVQADWLDEVARTGKVEDLSAEKQTILFLGDILEKEGSDKYVKKLLDPNSSEKEVKDSMMQIYLKLHHTNPDEATLKRAKKYIR
jgi:hypothetical protein